MKILKPDTVSLLPRILRMSGSHYWGATVLLGFNLEGSPGLREESSLWEDAAQALGEERVLDSAIPKPAAEVLLVGACYPASGQPAKAGRVRVAVAGLDKTLYVFGDRRWKRGLSGPAPSEPEPFSRMPLDWSHAFGGADDPRNPLGRGACEESSPEGEGLRPLPNIEDPKQLVTSPKDRPEPAGFGPLPMHWPQRSQRLGAVDEAWLKTQWPFYPRDTDFHFFNTAPQDQWLSSWPQGEESFFLEGVSPSGRPLRGALPGYMPRVFVTRGRDGKEDFSEIPLHIDTIWFFPDYNLGVLAFRGAFHVDDEEASEIDYCHVAVDKIKEPKFLPFHYQDFQNLIRPPAEPAPVETPPKAAEPEPAPTPPAPKPSPEEQAQLRAAEEELRKAELLLAAELAKMGIAVEPERLQASQTPSAPAPAQPSEKELPSEDRVDEFAETADLDAQLKEAEARLDQLLAEAGLPPSEAAETADQAASLLAQEPSIDEILARDFDAGAILATLKAADLLTPELEREVREMEREFALNKQFLAEHKAKTEQAPPEPPNEADAVKAPWDRTAIQQAWAKGRRDFSNEDFSRADLSGLDLSGAILRQAVLQATNFSNAVLDGADLRGADCGGALFHGARAVAADFSQAVLAQADLRQAVLSTSRFDEADLSGAQGQGADANEASLRAAVLLNADFSGATLAKADMAAALCADANFSEAVLSAARLKNADFRRAKLAHARLDKAAAAAADFSGADLTSALLQEAALPGASLDGALLTGADFSHADLTSACLFAATGEQTRFHQVNAANLRADKATALPGAEFVKARLSLAYFGGADLSRARFDEAVLDGATLQKCLLVQASFHRAHARGARFLGCDLSEANFRGADLLQGALAKSLCAHTDFSGANLFAVDTLQTVFRGSAIERANLGRTRIEEAR
jgi:uncharacterized protein YjbI with pentapeptide repeats